MSAILKSYSCGCVEPNPYCSIHGKQTERISTLVSALEEAKRALEDADCQWSAYRTTNRCSGANCQRCAALASIEKALNPKT